jgi:hypothetical protein
MRESTVLFGPAYAEDSPMDADLQALVDEASLAYAERRNEAGRARKTDATSHRCGIGERTVRNADGRPIHLTVRDAAGLGASPRTSPDIRDASAESGRVTGEISFRWTARAAPEAGDPARHAQPTCELMGTPHT